MATTTGHIDFTEGAAPSTPASTHWRIYAKTDGLYYIDDAAVETGPLVDSSGSGGIPATLIDAAGDLIIGSAADTAARLAVGGSGKIPTSNGTTLAYAYPPGYSYNYTEGTAAVTSITATTEATANTILTAGTAVTYDGSTTIDIIFEAPYLTPPTDAANRNLSLWLYDATSGGTASIGRLGTWTSPVNAQAMNMHVHVTRRLTPSATAHTYSVRASVNAGTGANAAVQAGPGGNGALMPMYIQQRQAG